ncbi:uncharacterized protein IWZ02DRAFT_464736 [Phyllosticta citriasiana]|uniref:uncharacterized protein n=1 Tax=Phyllosticta citriasiana TaxID=595635 RepID=UPI0030FDE037
MGREVLWMSNQGPDSWTAALVICKVTDPLCFFSIQAILRGIPLDSEQCCKWNSLLFRRDSYQSESRSRITQPCVRTSGHLSVCNSSQVYVQPTYPISTARLLGTTHDARSSPSLQDTHTSACSRVSTKCRISDNSPNMQFVQPAQRAEVMNHPAPPDLSLIDCVDDAWRACPVRYAARAKWHVGYLRRAACGGYGFAAWRWMDGLTYLEDKGGGSWV